MLLTSIFRLTKIPIAVLLLFGQMAWGQNAPNRAYRFIRSDIEQLADNITANAETDSQKVACIHYWVTHHIRYDAKRYVRWKTEGQDARRVLKKRKTLCTGYANLFEQLCQSSGISCIVVNGYTKNILVDQGDTSYLPDHSWNLVKYNGRWHPVDNTWDAGYVEFYKTGILRQIASQITLGRISPYKYKPHFIKQPSDRYFNISSSDFTIDHLPENPRIQNFTPSLSSWDFDLDSTYFYMETSRRTSLSTSPNTYFDTYSSLTEDGRIRSDGQNADEANPKNKLGETRFHSSLLKEQWKQYMENKDILSKDSAFLKDLITRADSIIAFAQQADSLNWEEYRDLSNKWRTKRSLQRHYARDYMNYLKRIDRKRKTTHTKTRRKINQENGRQRSFQHRYRQLYINLIRKPGNYPRKPNETRADSTSREFRSYSDRLSNNCDSIEALKFEIDDSLQVLQRKIVERSEYIDRIATHFEQRFAIRFDSYDDFDLPIIRTQTEMTPHSRFDSTSQLELKFDELYTMMDSLYRLSKNNYRYIRKQKSLLKKIKRSTNRRMFYQSHRNDFDHNFLMARSSENRSSRFRTDRFKQIKRWNKKNGLTGFSKSKIRLEASIHLPSSILKNKRSKYARDIKIHRKFANRVRNKSQNKLDQLRS